MVAANIPRPKDKVVATLTLANGVLAEPNGGGPVDVFFVDSDRLLSDVLTDCVAKCKAGNLYVQASLTLVFKSGGLVVDAPAEREATLAALDAALAARGTDAEVGTTAAKGPVPERHAPKDKGEPLFPQAAEGERE